MTRQPLRRRQLLQLGAALALAGAGSGRPAAGKPGAAREGAAPQQRLRLLAVADTGSGDANQRAVALQMAEVHRRRPVDLVLLGGDTIYPDGDLARVEATFEGPYRDLLTAGVPFHGVLGNHDILTANGDPHLAYRPFGMAGRWYALRRGPVQLLMLDTNSNARWQHQLPWLRQQLASSTAPWKVVMGHHPLVSSGLYGDDAAGQARLLPLLRRYQVQLYINGHDHHYERSLPLDGTTFLTVGGGGASLRPVLASSRTARAVSRFSFAELEFVGSQLQLQAWDSRGNRIDQADIASG